MSTSGMGERSCRRFPLADIQLATGDFSVSHRVGKGGFGVVYKGCIDNGSTIVAVKRLNPYSLQGEAEFTAEIDILSNLRHRNIVSLVGYCDEEGEKILVYEYIANQTLHYHLQRSASALTWKDRLNICIGVGRGLDYLHTGCSRKIVHRDMKSRNILLTEDLVAKVSDFGLAKYIISEDVNSPIASFKGTIGYLDPHFLKTGELTTESDVYAFGVVLLEVVSETSPTQDTKLVSNFTGKKKYKEMIASNLNSKGIEFSEKSMKEFMKLAASCLDSEPTNRPTMNQAVAHLQSALKFHEERRPTHQLKIGERNSSRVVQSGYPEAIPNDVMDYVPAIVVPAIPLAKLKEATDQFDPKRLISPGGRGSLFHGVLREIGKDVAIKRLNKKSPGKEFLQEVSEIFEMQHENVVQLLGYCMDGGLQVLAYEYAPRRSLHDILHGTNASPLSWDQRTKIAVGAAQGLCYIHEKGLIHHNIKSSNILLFDDQTAKITDVHLSTDQYPCKESHNKEAYELQFGCRYHAPEFGLSGQTQKIDVYSFGVVLLELLTGRMPFDSKQPPKQQFLAEWARRQLSPGKVKDIVDARAGGGYPERAVEQMAEVATLCLKKGADSRPEMGTVLRSLRKVSWEIQTYIGKR